MYKVEGRRTVTNITNKFVTVLFLMVMYRIMNEGSEFFDL